MIQKMEDKKLSTIERWFWELKNYQIFKQTKKPTYETVKEMATEIIHELFPPSFFIPDLLVFNTLKKGSLYLFNFFLKKNLKVSL